MYWVAQTIGILTTVASVISYQMKRKWQILIFSALANFFSAISFLLLGGAMSGMVVCAVGVAQTLINAHHAYNCKLAGMWEKIIFLIIYVTCGLLQFHSMVDALPLFGSIFFMIATFCKNAQSVRRYQLVSITAWIVYDVIIGSTALIAQLLSLVSVLVGLWRYRKQPQISAEQGEM